MRAIAQNAGFEGSVAVEHVKGMGKGEGLNCANGEYGNMIEIVGTIRLRLPVRLCELRFRRSPYPHHQLRQPLTTFRRMWVLICLRWLVLAAVWWVN